MKGIVRALAIALTYHACMSQLPGARAAEVRIERGRAASGSSTKATPRGEEKHELRVLVDGKDALTYSYSPDHFLPYFYPVKSPSGKDLTVRLTKPYPHHRSFWITDKVQLDGHRVVNFYMAHYPPKKGKGDRIRHDRFLETAGDGKSALLRMLLVWEMDKEKPALRETRTVRVTALGRREYFMDLRFTVAAAYGDVHFVCDAVHYAWPYVRMHPQFSVKSGGKLVNSEGGVNQKGTHNKVAKWCDYSNTVDGKTEGLAILSHPDNAYPHRWLTRDYGTFGPRRVDAKSGKRFTLKKGEALSRRVGILVHTGDAEGGRVAERYEQYARGRLSKLPDESEQDRRSAR